MSGHIMVVSSMATRQILADLASLYERRTGCKVEIESMGGVIAARTIRAGLDADVVILASDAMKQLETEGLIVAGSREDFARSDIAIAVRAGSPRPDIRDEASVKQAILAARRFCFSTGPSGDHLKRLLDRWDMSSSYSQRGVLAPAGVPVGELLARGDADIGFQQSSELLNFPGVEVVGLLPPEIQATTIFSAGISARTKSTEDSRALIAFLISRETETAKRRYGMAAPREAAHSRGSFFD